LQAKRTLEKINVLPKPSPGHLQALKFAVDNTYLNNAMTKGDREKRAKVFNELQQIVVSICGAG